MTTRLLPPAEVVRPAETKRAWRLVWLLLVVLSVAYAQARWTGYLPLGSDNDEYQLVGAALAGFDPPIVAGVEGTKYPLGYPAVLALMTWLRLMVAPGALVLNQVALLAAAVIVARVVGRSTPDLPANPGAGLAAGALLMTSASVWNDMYSVMPELLFLLVVAGMVATVARELTARSVAVLSWLAVAAVLLKTLGLLLVLGGSLVLAVVMAGGLAAGPAAVLPAAGPAAVLPAAGQTSRQPGEVPRTALGGAPLRVPGTVTAAHALRPVWWAVAVVAAGMLLMRRYPEHTTGYVATFFLVDPFDASLGTLGPLGLLERAWTSLPESLADLGRAIVLIDASTRVAAVVAVVGLSVGVVGAFRLRRSGALGPWALGATVAYAAGMAVWPYHSSRFGIPLVPIAALGVGWLVRLATDSYATVEVVGAAVATADEAVDAAAPRPGRALETRRRAAVGRFLLVSLMGGAVVTGGLVASSWGPVVDRGEQAEARLARQHAAMDELAAWADVELGERSLVSFDYREVAHRLDRDVAPLSYTSDTDVLWEQVGDAEVVVLVDFHHRRNQQLRLLLESRPDAFEPVLIGDGVGIWEVVRG